jgi:predicted nucleotidyltransferase component of viral defense system
MEQMDFERIRKTAIIAMFSIDDLLESLVLKGGNAVGLILGLSQRSSIDLDFSLKDDFKDIDGTMQKIKSALEDRFDSEGYVVFDYGFDIKPGIRNPTFPEFWGGYLIKFKILAKEKYKNLCDIDARRRNAALVAPGQKRVFTIDISKHEHCDSKLLTNLNEFRIYVYTPTALVLEKLRALCQQLPEYLWIGQERRRPRPRDFYDIHSIISNSYPPIELTMSENIDLLKRIFKAKDVPLSLIAKLKHEKAFHEQEFALVRDTVPGPIKTFDFYFSFVIDIIQPLESLGDM